MNLQEIFDATLEHLNNQGRAMSVNSHGTCMYRGNNGFKCALGFFIPDSMYDCRWEGEGISSLVGFPEFIHALRESGVDVKDPDVLNLLSSLQRFHDVDLSSPAYSKQVYLLERIAVAQDIVFNPKQQWPEMQIQ